MPTYEYRCPSCGTEFELFQKMSDPPVAPCPSCGAEAERRLSAGAGLLFKGSGFYITDYRGEGYKKAAEAEKGGGTSASSGSGDAKPAESKPASKPESKPAPKAE
ncbi:MAG TPA: zinc ribbon domain-containing protein [Longimicrobiaceae bacterium]|nr:zinc ribbon domain-containing protein [Longimicrobiaceae bacterium]